MTNTFTPTLTPEEWEVVLHALRLRIGTRDSDLASSAWVKLREALEPQ